MQDRRSYAALTGNLIDLSGALDASQVDALNAEADAEDRRGVRDAAVATAKAALDKIVKQLVGVSRCYSLKRVCSEV